MHNIILIRTDHDSATHYMYSACNPLIQKAETKGFKVIKIEGSNINTENVQKRIKKIKPRFIMFNGHGTKSAIFNNDEEEFINTKSAGLFENSVTFTRACDCIVSLGTSAINSGCETFIGYKHKFWIPWTHGFMSRPLQDKAAKPIIECSNIIVKELLNGRTAEEAINKSRELSSERIVDLIYSNDPFMSPALSALISNDSALDCKGNPKSKII